LLKQHGYLTVKEAAQLLGVSPNTIRAWGGAEKIAEYRHPVNNYRLYKKQELEALIAQVEESVSQPTPSPKQEKKGVKPPSQPR
jgi:DNA (cytosine-5)-methyltransferase 1